MPDRTSDSAATQKLLMRISSGDRDAFDVLFERHRPDLRRMIKMRLDPRLKGRIDASDVVQDTQMEAFRRLDDFLQRRPMPFALWLRKTAQERLSNYRRDHVTAARRSVQREQAFPDETSLRIAGLFSAHSSSPSRHLARSEHRRIVNEAVNELDELDREILLMRNVEGFSHQEIAQVLDLGHEAVRKRYGRALLKLQQLLVAKGLREVEP